VVRGPCVGLCKIPSTTKMRKSKNHVTPEQESLIKNYAAFLSHRYESWSKKRIRPFPEAHN
jgi:hypothetical protein